MPEQSGTGGTPATRLLADLDTRGVDRVVATYLVVATAWIVLSGPAGAWVAARIDAPILAVEISKRLLFVLVTALALRASLRRWAGRVEGAALAERDAAERLRQAERDRIAFVNAVSHEIRTPLTSIVGLGRLVQQLQGDGDHARAGELTPRLVANAERLERLIVDLLETGALLHGVGEPRFREAEVGELVRRVVATVDLGPRVVETSGDALTVEMDVAKIERCLQLLLGNVARHTPPGARALVTWHEEDGRLVLTVDDDGPGLPPEVRDRTFLPFVQGRDAVASPSPGLGLGLALVDQYVRLHGGRVTATDRPGGGARLRLRLPLRQPAAAATH